jgi:hypothetical protein
MDSRKKAVLFSKIVLVACAGLLAARIGSWPAGSARALSPAEAVVPHTSCTLDEGGAEARSAAAVLAAAQTPEIEFVRRTSYGDDSLQPALAYNSVRGHFLVVRSYGTVSGDRDILAQRVYHDGNCLDGECMLGGFAIDTIGRNVEPAVAYNSSRDEYLVVYTYQRTSSDYDIFGRCVMGDGSTPYPGFAIDTSVAKQSHPAVAYNSHNNEYLVVYQSEAGTGSNFYHIFGRRVAANGTLIGTGPTMLNPTWWLIDRETPDVAYNAARNQYLVIWNRMIWSSSPDDNDIAGQRLSDTLAKLDSYVEICDDGYDQIKPSVAAGDDEYMVVWADGPGNDPKSDYDIYGTRVSGDGTVLGYPSGYGIDWTGTNNRLGPQVAYDGLGYLVVWNVYHAATGWDVDAARVSTGGGLFAVSEIDIGGRGYDQYLRDVACLPFVTCMAAAEDYYYDSGSHAEVTLLLVRPYRSYLPLALRNY